MRITTFDTDVVTDSAGVTVAGANRFEVAGGGAGWPAVEYPPYTDGYLRAFTERLLAAAQGEVVTTLPGLREPALYALATALARGGGIGVDAADRRRLKGGGIGQGAAGKELAGALIVELRWRNCRAMGRDPSGAVRRGRLLQLAGAFTELEPLGASSLRRQKLAGRCPFCAGSWFQVHLPSVRWRCFGCERGGGLLELAEELLRAVAGATRDSLPAG